MLLQLFVLGLFLSKTSKAVPGIFDSLSNMAVNAVIKAVDDKVSSDDLRDVYLPILETLKGKLGEWSCLTGLYLEINNFDTTLMLVKGNMTGLDKVDVKVSMPLEDGDDMVSANVMFTFPDIPMSFEFHYTDHRAMIKFERQGTIELLQEGPIYLKYIMHFPRTRKTLQEMLEDKMCVAIIDNIESNISDKTVKIVKVNYQSYATAWGFSLTGSHVTSIVEGLEDDIQENLESALVVLLDPPFRKFYANCWDDTYSMVTEEEIRDSTDCNLFATATQYSPQD